MYAIRSYYENRPHLKIELYDSVSARPHVRLAYKTRVRNARDMNVMCRKVQEEGLVFVALDERATLLSQRVGHILVHPAGFLAPRHVPDAADSVHHSYNFV